MVGVVVPAHDEEGSIERCLRSIRRAASHPALSDVRVEVVVVLDSCTDATAEVVEQVSGLLVSTVSANHHNVGRARRDGFAAVLERTGPILERTWLATTDADTVVPPDWLARQLAWRRRGAHGVAGTVRVADWGARGIDVRERFTAHQAAVGMGHGHSHVHGANLGLAAGAYLGVGGMPALELAEDHALWAALYADGRPLQSAGDLAVTTSARSSTRAPGGFSTFLGQLARGAAGSPER